MAVSKSTENQADLKVAVDKLKEVTQERDEGRRVIAAIGEALGLVSGATDEQVVSAAGIRHESLRLLGDAAGAGPDEPWDAVAHRVRAAGDYVRVLRGGVG